MLCALILYVSGGTYIWTLTPNDRFLRNFFMAGLFTLRVFARYLLKGNRRRVFRILLSCLACGWGEIVEEKFSFSFLILMCVLKYDNSFTSNKSKQYSLDYGDFLWLCNGYVVFLFKEILGEWSLHSTNRTKQSFVMGALAFERRRVSVLRHK